MRGVPEVEEAEVEEAERWWEAELKLSGCYMPVFVVWLLDHTYLRV